MSEYKPSLTETDSCFFLILLTIYLQTRNTENLDSTLLPLSSDRPFFISDLAKRLTIFDTEIGY